MFHPKIIAFFQRYFSYTWPFKAIIRSFGTSTVILETFIAGIQLWYFRCLIANQVVDKLFDWHRWELHYQNVWRAFKSLIKVAVRFLKIKIADLKDESCSLDSRITCFHLSTDRILYHRCIKSISFQNKDCFIEALCFVRITT